MDIDELRAKIDAIDADIVKLFCERMRVCADIAGYKAEHGLAVYDPARERSKLADVLRETDVELSEYIVELYTCIFKQSKAYQLTVDS